MTENNAYTLQFTRTTMDNGTPSSMASTVVQMNPDGSSSYQAGTLTRDDWNYLYNLVASVFEQVRENE